ncbi:uncharacterized protein LOC118763735 [Octopus sinensis]|uniref:Uncharacterized protein LOC118763735 n=1 Tax=Octopus sinensis TaxID=2607531 RepID=A0A7E6EVI8_9MOLL|nr:uncharacterized protein LOC118763735 [Octopus sinensis]
MSNNSQVIVNNTNIFIVSMIRYGSIVLLTLGTLFNVAVIGIFYRKELRQSKMPPYLICLAIVDLASVWINYPQFICCANVIENQTGTFFPLHPSVNVISYSLNMISTWLIVVIYLERLMAVYSPFSRLQSSNTYTPYVVMFFLFYLCFYNKHHDVYILLKDYWLTLHYSVILYAFIPAAFLISSSILMIYKLLRRPNLDQQFQRNSSARSRNTIRLVIAIDTIILLTKFPVSICITFLNPNNEMHQSDSNTIVVLSAVPNIHNCVNFLCYVTTSKVFRENLKQVCFRKPTGIQQRIYTLQNPPKNQRNQL